MADTMKKENEIISYGSLARSNSMITAKYHSSLFENKLTILALKKVKPDEYGRPSVTLTTDQLRSMTGVKGNGLYDAIKKASLGMGSRSIFIEDLEKKRFKYINLVHKAEFEKGNLTITFTPECNEMLYDLKSNFTSMRLETLFSFKSNYAFRLYEILKVHGYKIGVDNTPVVVSYDLATLKLEMNCIDTEDKKVKTMLAAPNPDLNRIFDLLPKEQKRFIDWYEFKRKVLERAIKEVNEKTELHVDYTPIRTGIGGKITRVDFHLKYKKDTDVDKGDIIIDLEHGDRAEQESDLENKVFDILQGVKITVKDARRILNAAGGDLEEIKRIYGLSKKQGVIKNFVGWMLTALRDHYEDSVEVEEGDQENAQITKSVQRQLEAHKDELAETMWNHIKEKEDFSGFERFIEMTTGLSMGLYEGLIDVQERNKTYSEWFCGQNNS